MKFFRLEMLSEYRSPIMGFAMIWVVLYHFQMEGPLLAPIRFGFTGVDLFMFVSGLGLYFSMTKEDNVKNFYNKRLLRILPLYYLIGLVYELLVGNFDFLTYLWKYSTVGFWTNSVYGNGWFIPSIVALYALYPYVYRTLFKNRMDSFALKILAVILFFFIFYISVIDQSLLEVNHFLLLYRVPIFLLGSVVGFILNDKKHIKIANRWFVRLSLLLIPLSIVVFLIDHKSSYGIYLSTTFSAPIIMVALCIIFEKISVLRSVLGGVGKASLEIFMIQAIPLMYLDNHLLEFKYHNIGVVGLCSVVVMLGIFIHWVYSMLERKINQIFIRIT